MTAVSQSPPIKPISWMRRVVVDAVLVLLGFTLGFVPMWVKSRASASSLAEATSRANLVRTQNALASAGAAQQLDLARMQNMLASAALDAQRGNYESARQAASGFFTALGEQANRGADSTLSQAQREGVQPLLTQRDEVITLLARSDTAAAGRLSDLYVSFRELTTK